MMLYRYRKCLHICSIFQLTRGEHDSTTRPPFHRLCLATTASIKLLCCSSPVRLTAAPFLRPGPSAEPPADLALAHPPVPLSHDLSRGSSAIRWFSSYGRDAGHIAMLPFLPRLARSPACPCVLPPRPRSLHTLPPRLQPLSTHTKSLLQRAAAIFGPSPFRPLVLPWPLPSVAPSPHITSLLPSANFTRIVCTPVQMTHPQTSTYTCTVLLRRSLYRLRAGFDWISGAPLRYGLSTFVNSLSPVHFYDE